MEKDCECYEEEVQPYRKMDYKPIIYIYIARTKDMIKIIAVSGWFSYLSVQGEKPNLVTQTDLHPACGRLLEQPPRECTEHQHF